MLPTCLPTAASETTSCRAIAAFECPSAMRGEDLALTCRQRGERVAAAAQQLADDLRVDHGLADGHAAQRDDEVLDVGYPVFEQVADTAAVPGVQQVGGVGVLHVLAEHDHGQPWAVAAQLDGGPQPLVGEPGWHSDIGDDQVRGMLGDCGLERLGVAYRGDRPEAEPFEQSGEALSQQDPVLG
jgi:hypothetical protein